MWYLTCFIGVVYAYENRLLRTFEVGKGLTCLLLSDCDLRSLPHDLFHHALERLDLRGNKGERSRYMIRSLNLFHNWCS